MVRASKLPFKNFQSNIRRAEALTRLDGYLEDILHNEGKRTIGVFLNLPKELMQSFEMDKLMRDIEKTFEAHFKAEYDKKSKQHFENIAKDLARRLKPHIEKISEIFQDLGLLMDQTLLERARSSLGLINSFLLWLMSMSGFEVLHERYNRVYKMIYFPKTKKE